MTYDDSAKLMNDQDFRGRVKVAILQYSNYILDEAPTVAAHNTRFKWAIQATQQPDLTAANLQPVVVMDGAVQGAGADITDAALQSSVETVINKLL